MRLGFTPEELAELAAFDEEVEAEFRFTQEELERSRMLDRHAVLEGKDNRARRVAAQQKAYYEANRDKVAAQQKAYTEANRDKVAAQQKAYREANRGSALSEKSALRAARKRAGLTQKDVGAMLGVHHSTVSYWERLTPPDNWQEIVRRLEGFQWSQGLPTGS